MAAQFPNQVSLAVTLLSAVETQKFFTPSVFLTECHNIHGRLNLMQYMII